jgi:hypothetical protein
MSARGRRLTRLAAGCLAVGAVPIVIGGCGTRAPKIVDAPVRPAQSLAIASVTCAGDVPTRAPCRRPAQVALPAGWQVPTGPYQQGSKVSRLPSLAFRYTGGCLEHITAAAQVYSRAQSHAVDDPGSTVVRQGVTRGWSWRKLQPARPAVAGSLGHSFLYSEVVFAQRPEPAGRWLGVRIIAGAEPASMFPLRYPRSGLCTDDQAWPLLTGIQNAALYAALRTRIG